MGNKSTITCTRFIPYQVQAEHNAGFLSLSGFVKEIEHELAIRSALDVITVFLLR